MVLAQLEQGSCFGEMSLLEDGALIRNASALAVADVSAAILSKEDFRLICDSYPSFFEAVKEIVKERNTQTQSPKPQEKPPEEEKQETPQPLIPPEPEAVKQDNLEEESAKSADFDMGEHLPKDIDPPRDENL